jgi:hypothetical protein
LKLPEECCRNQEGLVSPQHCLAPSFAQGGHSIDNLPDIGPPNLDLALQDHNGRKNGLDPVLHPPYPIECLLYFRLHESILRIVLQRLRQRR